MHRVDFSAVCTLPLFGWGYQRRCFANFFEIGSICEPAKNRFAFSQLELVDSVLLRGVFFSLRLYVCMCVQQFSNPSLCAGNCHA